LVLEESEKRERENQLELNSVQTGVGIKAGRWLKNTRYKIAILGRHRKSWKTRRRGIDDREGDVKWGVGEGGYKIKNRVPASTAKIQ
jgi:hypothetical protein